MKKILIALMACVGLTFSAIGCAEEGYYSDPPVSPTVGSVEYCDDMGCRYVNAPYYYVGGEVVYWDAHFGCWIGPRSYWRDGRWYRGSVSGFHGYYHSGANRGFYGGGGAWRPNGGGYHGGFHGGGHGHR
jgi:hypothetical protein